MSADLRSAIYVGRVRHRRMTPVDHAFSFPLFMMYLDLAELDGVFRGSRMWSTRRPALAWLRRSDYLAPHAISIADAVRARVEAETGVAPSGPIRMLTHLRYYGYCFNPVTFYYCSDAADTRVDTIVAEITNTPWRERHAYVLHPGMDEAENPGRRRFRFAKTFHVSPFMPLDIDYDWTFSDPGPDLFVHMNLRRPGQNKVFDATLTMQRRPISPAALRGLLVRYPMMTAQVIARIHFEALRLWLKRAPIHPHPRTQTLPPSLGS